MAPYDKTATMGRCAEKKKKSAAVYTDNKFSEISCFRAPNHTGAHTHTHAHHIIYIQYPFGAIHPRAAAAAAQNIDVICGGNLIRPGLALSSRSSSSIERPRRFLSGLSIVHRLGNEQYNYPRLLALFPPLSLPLLCISRRCWDPAERVLDVSRVNTSVRLIRAPRV